MSNTYIDVGVENNDKGLKLKVGNHVKIYKHKDIFGKCYKLNWLEEVFFLLKHLKILYDGT